MALRLPRRLRGRRRGKGGLLDRLDEEGLKKLLGELMAANRATQANFDKIIQQFPIQPSNLADSIPTWEELEEGGLEPPEGEGEFGEQLLPIENQGDIIVGDEEGKPAILPIGKTGQVLTVDPSSPYGVSWGGDTTAGPEENGGEDLTPELAKWINVANVHVNEEEDNNATLEFPYNPPADCDYVAFCLMTYAGTPEGLPKKLTLDGEEADAILINVAELEQMYIYLFKNPSAGQVVITNTGTTQKEYAVLPISFKNQGGKPLEHPGTASDTTLFSQQSVTKVDTEFSVGALGGVSVMMAVRNEEVADPTPPGTIDHSGVKVLDLPIKNKVFNWRVEVAVELVPPGIVTRHFEWAGETKRSQSQRAFGFGLTEEPV